MMSIIQVAVSIVLIYFLFSVIVYVIVEWIAGLLELRGVILRRSIYDLFNDNMNQDFGALLYSHPQVENLKKSRDNLPSYIPSHNIAVGLIDLVGKQAEPPLYALNPDKTLAYTNRPICQIPDPYQRFVSGLDAMWESHLKTLLVNLYQHSGNLSTLTQAIERWYDTYMQRVSGWYKKRVRTIVIIVSILVTLAFNVDSIHIFKRITADPHLQKELNAAADQIIKDTSIQQAMRLSLHSDLDSLQRAYVGRPGYDSAYSLLIHSHIQSRQQQYQQLTENISSWNLPVGWGPRKNSSLLLSVLGWMLTVAALSAGAPFWFDALKRLVNVRNAGRRPLTTNKQV
jgi:hypothetical protein